MKTKKFKLKDGTPLIIVPILGSLSVTTMALVKAGPRFDPSGKEGLSHFVEHMLARGTKKWPTQLLLSSVLERQGATDFAFSYYETNRYWIKSASRDIELAIENLTDRIYNPLFRENDIELERGVVEEELRIVQSNPQTMIWELWSQVVWSNSALGRIYIGDKNTIKSFSRENFVDFWNSYYNPSRMVFVVSGDVDINNVVDMFNKHIEIRNAEHNKEEKLESFDRTGQNVLVSNSNNETITIALGFQTIKFGHTDNNVLELIASILGGGMSSRLRQKVMASGLTYSIEADTRHLSDTGYFMIRFTTDKNNLQKTIKIILEEFELLKSVDVGKEELKLAVGYLSGQLLVNMETSYDWASYYSDQYILNPSGTVEPQDKILKIESVTSDMIKDVAGKYFLKENIKIAAIGNIEKKDIILALN